MTARPILRPFDFLALLRPVPRRWFFLAWFNVALVLGLLSLVGSRLILAPGIEVGLPGALEADRMAVGTSLVVSVTRSEVVFFAGRRLSLGEFESALRRELAGREGVSLLVRADRSLTLESLLRLTDAARRAGVARVQLAAPRPGSTGAEVREVR